MKADSVGRGRWLLGGLFVVLAVLLVLLRQDRQTELSSGPRAAPPGQMQERESVTLEAAQPPNAALETSGGESRTAIGKAATEAAAAQQVEPNAVALVGKIVDEEARPLAGARVELVPVTRQFEVEVAAYPPATKSDAEGHFRLEPLGQKVQAMSELFLVRASLSGYRQLHGGRLVSREGIGFAPVEVVMTPTARVRVAVYHEDDEPIDGAHIEIAPIGAELPGDVGQSWPLFRVSTHARTDFAGIATLEVHAGHKLRVSIVSGQNERVSESIVDGVLDFERAGAPLLLSPGEDAAWTARLGQELVITGKVRLQDGTPVSGANLRLFDRDPSLFGFADAFRETQTGEDGRFRIVLWNLLPETELTLLAVDAWWWGVSGQGPIHGESLRLDANRAVDGVLEVDIQLKGLLRIRGSVLDEGGQPFSGTAWAIPAGAAYRLQKNALGLLPICAILERQGGSFDISGLPPGMYDLIIKRGEPRTYYRFNGYAAGAEDVELVIEDDRSVQVHLSFVGATDGVIVQPVLLRHDWRDPAARPRQTAALLVDVEACVFPRWPWKLRKESIEGTEGRTVVTVLNPQAPQRNAFEPLQPGWYSVGARVTDASGSAFAPRLSPPYFLSDGDYEFRIHLVPTTGLRGQSLPPGELLEFVELVNAAGDRIPAAGGTPLTATDADGNFQIDDVPVGELRVRIGAWQDLEAGRWRVERRVTTRAGEVSAVRMDD